MDLSAIESKLESGNGLKIKYRYPIESGEYDREQRYGVRSDKLLDVSTELERLYINFRGNIPIWVELDEVIEITPDDGLYLDFAE